MPLKSLLAAYVFVISCVLATIIPAKLLAQDAPWQSYCKEGERYYPDGLIGHVGERFFRVCDGLFRYPPQTNAPYLAMRKQHRIDKLLSKKILPSLRYHSQIKTYDARPHAGTNTKVGEVILGGLTYTALLTELSAAKLDHVVTNGSVPRRTLLYFQGSQEDNIAEHFLYCIADPTKLPQPDNLCQLTVRYRASESLYLHKLFIMNETLNTKPLYDTPHFDFDLLVTEIRGLQFVYQQQDVTDQIDTFKGLPRAKP